MSHMLRDSTPTSDGEVAPTALSFAHCITSRNGNNPPTDGAVPQVEKSPWLLQMVRVAPAATKGNCYEALRLTGTRRG